MSFLFHSAFYGKLGQIWQIWQIWAKLKRKNFLFEILENADILFNFFFCIGECFHQSNFKFLIWNQKRNTFL